jgi:DNA replication protein DnaC
MNTETLEKMKKMRLLGMHRTFQTSLQTPRPESLTMDEMITQLIDSEWDDRQNRSIDRSMKRAKFRYNATLENLDYAQERGIDKNQIHRFADGSFIRNAENILVTGSTGTGKSFLASALGHQACLIGYKVLYMNATRLFAQLKMAKADGSIIKEMARIERQDLLIIDDFGIQPFDHPARLSLLELIEDRHGKRSTIFTSQLPVKQWHDVIGEQTVADAVLDRIVHNAHRVHLKVNRCAKNGRRKQWSKTKNN